MKNIKTILKTTIYMIIIFIAFSLILTILNYFNILNYQSLNIIKIIIPLITSLIGGFLIGKKAEKNGWLEGLKLSSVLSIFFIIITLALKQFKPEYLIYILVLTITNIFGSMLGINKK